MSLTELQKWCDRQPAIEWDDPHTDTANAVAQLQCIVCDLLDELRTAPAAAPVPEQPLKGSKQP